MRTYNLNVTREELETIIMALQEGSESHKHVVTGAVIDQSALYWNGLLSKFAKRLDGIKAREAAENRNDDLDIF